MGERVRRFVRNLHKAAAIAGSRGGCGELGRGLGTGGGDPTGQGNAAPALPPQRSQSGEDHPAPQDDHHTPNAHSVGFGPWIGIDPVSTPTTMTAHPSSITIP